MSRARRLRSTVCGARQTPREVCRLKVPRQPSVRRSHEVRCVDKRIAAIIAETKGPSVLDIGCAGGLQTDIPPLSEPRWLHGHLVQAFEDVWGIDLEPARISFLQEHGYPNVRVGSAETFDLGRTFDTIVAGELIEHLPNAGLFLDRCRLHLKPNGRLVVTTPYPFGYEAIAYAWFKWPQTCGNPEHTSWLCPANIRRLASMCSFRVERSIVLRDDRLPDGWGAYSWAIRVSRVASMLPVRIAARTILYVLRPLDRAKPATRAPRMI